MNKRHASGKECEASRTRDEAVGDVACVENRDKRRVFGGFADNFTFLQLFPHLPDSSQRRCGNTWNDLPHPSTYFHVFPLRVVLLLKCAKYWSFWRNEFRVPAVSAGESESLNPIGLILDTFVAHL